MHTQWKLYLWKHLVGISRSLHRPVVRRIALSQPPRKSAGTLVWGGCFAFLGVVFGRRIGVVYY